MGIYFLKILYYKTKVHYNYGLISLVPDLKCEEGLTQNDDHEIPEPQEAGRMLRIMAEA